VNLLEGENVLWIELKDSGGNHRWIRRIIILDTAPPQAVITQPQIINQARTVVTRPLIQLQGYTTERLAGVSYCLTNSLNTNTDQRGVVLGHDTDPVTDDYIQTRFQCYDLDLAPGQNDVYLNGR